jgi:hypothetical protein
MPGLDFRRAREEIRLAEVLELLGYQPRQQTTEQLRGLCLVHRSQSTTSRSFAAHLGKGVWQCFVCGASGNTLDLWAAVTGQGIYEAVLDLYRRLARVPPFLQETTMREP